jgi:hypothetical protein
MRCHALTLLISIFDFSGEAPTPPAIPRFPFHSPNYDEGVARDQTANMYRARRDDGEVLVLRLRPKIDQLEIPVRIGLASV